MSPKMARPELDDGALAIALGAQTPEAASLLFDRYASLVRRLLTRTLGPHHDIDDLVQDVFFAAFRAIRTLRDPTALRSWLVGITLRHAKSELRRRRVRRFFHLSDDGELPEVAGVDGRTRQALARVFVLLDTLDDRSRLAFVLRHFEGYDLPEVANLIGCSLATVKRVLTQAQLNIESRATRDPELAPWLQKNEFVGDTVLELLGDSGGTRP